jgi:hypothetical protein
MALILTTDTDPGSASFTDWGAAGSSILEINVNSPDAITLSTDVRYVNVVSATTDPARNNVELTLPSTYPVGVMLAVMSTPEGGFGARPWTLVLVPESGIIYGDTTLEIFSSVGVTLVFNGTGWNVVGANGL